MAHCINVNSKELQALSKKLNIKPESLIGAIQEWLNDHNVDTFPSEQYLNRYYKLSGESATQFSSVEEFKDALELWERDYSKNKNYVDGNEALTVYNQALQLFGKDNVSIVPRVDKSFDVVVLKPTKNIIDGNFDTKLDAKLREILQTLFPEIHLEYTNKSIYDAGNPYTEYQKSSILTSAQKQAKDIFFNEVYNQYISQYQVAAINEKLRRISDRLGDAPWRLAISQKGNYYIAGYSKQSVTSDSYWSPHINKYYQRDTKQERVIGQADLKAMTVLIDAIHQNQDTLPHEYAHHYIAWYRNSPIVQTAIKKYGSEEKLVQAIGEQVVTQRGDVRAWWRRFFNWIKLQFSKADKQNIQDLTNYLTDAFLQAKKLGQVNREVYGKMNQSIDEIRSTFYNNKVLGAKDREYLAKQAVNLFSNVIDQLQGNGISMNAQEATEFYFGDTYKDKDFTKMTRQQIIKTISPKGIFDQVRDKFFDPLERDDIEDEAVLEQLEVAYENFYELLNSAYHKLISAEHITLTGDNSAWVNDTESEDLMAGVEEAKDGTKEKESWQKSFQNISVRESLSPLIKRALDKIRKRNEDGSFITDKYGLIEIVDTDTVYNTILQSINKALSIDQMEEILKSMVNTNPWVRDVLELIKKEPFRSQFYQNFRKDFLTYSIVSREIDDNGNYFYKTSIINTRNIETSIIEDVQEALKSNELGLVYNVDPVTGKGEINTTLLNGISLTANDLIKELDSKQVLTPKDLEAFTSKNLNMISSLLQTMGISINDIALNAFLHNTKTKADKFKKEQANAFKLLELISSATEVMKNTLNPESYEMFGNGDDNVKGFYRDIAKLLSSVLSDSVESSTYENGKLYYSYVTPSYLGKLVLNLKNVSGDKVAFKEFMDNNYLQYGWFKNTDANGEIIYNSWLRELSAMNKDGDDARKLFDHKVQLHFNKTAYSDLSGIDYTLSLFQEFFSDFSKKPTYAWYHLPILADKPSAEFIKYKRYTNANTVNGYEAKIISELTNLAKQELRRIKTVLERAQNGSESITSFDLKLTKEMKDKLKSGQKLTVNELLSISDDNAGGSRFKFLDFLNPILSDTSLEGHDEIIRYLKGEASDPLKITNAFKALIKEAMEDKFNSALSTWDSIGVFEESVNPKTKEKGFVYLKNLGSTNQEVYDNLKNYFYNSYLATANIIQLTVTDIAFYKDAEDFQKRYAQIHSPALRFNTQALDAKGERYSNDGIETTMYIQDEEIPSLLSDQVSKIFDNKIAKATNNAQKKGYERLKKSVLDSLQKINVTDAQGYTTLKGYRKKMGMSGKWTSQMQEAYERILAGNWNLSDLDVVWQPLKPFVYSQITKNSYAKTINKLKVPVQNKNSEYLLLMAAAITAGSNGNNKLKAINDFMEKNDIDTIQFESAVKSGKQGVININNAKSEQEVKAILEAHLYERTADGATVMEGGKPKFNEQYVHRISFEDYGIQQEVPEHLTDASQLFGSQIRKLIMADITPGTVFQVGKEKIGKDRLLQEYQELIAANVQDSYNNLIEDLLIKNADIKEKNKAISALLVDEIKKNARYGPELLRAVSLNDEGDFIVPLADPTHSYRIQQLFNSIIKSRLTKQKIKGGSVVQVSPYGLANDLNIVFNEDGSIKHFECYIPIPSESWKDILREVDDNGNEFYNINKLDKNGKPLLSDEMRQLIGYRIPTEDKYSMAPLYIKGFLPEQAGSAIMLPKEITLLSGSDYDIDKMYVMLPEFEATPYYERDKFIDDLIKTLGNEPTETLRANIKEVLDKGKDHIWEEGTNEANIYKTWVSNMKKYSNWDRGSIRKVTYDVNKSALENSVEARNNRLIDIMYGVLTNVDTADKIFNPGSFDVQKKSARIITILKSGKGYSYEELSKMSLKELDGIINKYALKGKITLIDPTTQVYFHQLNTTAGKLIGIFANHNTSHALLQLQNINFNLENDIVFDGVSFNSISGDGKMKLPAKLDSIISLDGSTLITKNIAGFLAASVDAVKDPVLNFMNLNTFTANTAMVLARLGFDSDAIGLLLTQPMVEKVTKEFFKRNNEQFVAGDVIITEGINHLIKDLGGNIKEKDRAKYLSSTNFSKDNLAKMLSVDPESAEAKEFQLDTLILFKKLFELGTNLNELTFITKFDTVSNAVGPTIADTLAKKLRVEKFMNKRNSKKAPFGSYTYDVLENSPILNAFYSLNQQASEEIFGEYFPHFQNDVKLLLEILREDTVGDVDANTVNVIINDYIAYKLTSDAYQDSVFSGTEEERKKYIVDYPREAEKRLLSNIKMAGNDLVKVLSVKSPTTKVPVNSLVAKMGGLSADAIEKVKNSWSDLATNDSTKQEAQDLFKYNFYRSGFSFSPTSFMHAASIEVKYGLPGYISALRRNSNNSIFDELTEGLIKDFIILLKRNHTDNRKLVPNANKENLTVTNLNENRILITDDNNPELNNIVTSEYMGQKIFASVITLTETDKAGNTLETVWINTTDGSEAEYVKSTPLGIKSNALEYSFNPLDVANSVIESNAQGKIVKRAEKENKEYAPSEVASYLSEDNQELAKQIVSEVTNMTQDEMNKILGTDKNKRSKAIKLLRAFVPGFKEMDNTKSKNLIDYFEKITIRDAKGDKIC